MILSNLWRPSWFKSLIVCSSSKSQIGRTILHTAWVTLLAPFWVQTWSNKNASDLRSEQRMTFESYQSWSKNQTLLFQALNNSDSLNLERWHSNLPNQFIKACFSAFLFTNILFKILLASAVIVDKTKDFMKNEEKGNSFSKNDWFMPIQSLKPLL